MNRSKFSAFVFVTCVAAHSIVPTHANAFGQADKPLIRRASLGIQFAPLGEEDKAASATLGGKGVKIVRVIPGLSAEAAKLQAGDILYKLGGKPVATVPDVAPLMHGKREGSEMTFEVLRNGVKTVLKSTLVAKPKQKEDGFKVEYDQVVSKGKRIRVIYTHPEGKGPFPTLFMIGGIGAYSADGDYPGVAYGNILGPLAKRGYAIVRMDKPGQGDSEGPMYTDLLFEDELDAYLQTIKQAKGKSYIDAKRIAIFGHSMGGAFGPLVAEQEPVKGVAVCGTMTKTWIEYNLENTRRQSLLAGANAAEVDAELRGFAALNHYLYHDGLSPKEIVKKHPNMKEVVLSNIPDLKTYSGVGLPFFQQLAKKNLMGSWANVKSNVLVLWGENDFISTEWDHSYLADSINKLRPGTASYIRIPNSDHGFFTTSSQLDSMMKWGKGGTPFNANIIDILGDWLAKTLK